MAAAWRLIQRSVRGWVDDAAPSMGAALAFYTLFSLAPLLLLAIAIAGFFVGRGEAQSLLVAQLAHLVGDKAALGVQSLLESAGARDPGQWPAVIGTLTLALGASTVFAELRRDLDRIWGCTGRKSGGVVDFLRTRVLSFGMVVSIGFLLLVSLAASTALSALGSRWLAGVAVLRAVEFAVSFLVITGLFAMIYKVLPTAKIAWEDVWVGAAVTSLFFWIGKFLIGVYIGHAAMQSTFGAAGALVAVVAWVYYSAQVFFLGAEFTREYARLHGSRAAQHDLHEHRRPRGEAHAANDDLVERAVKIVKGTDPAISGL